MFKPTTAEMLGKSQIAHELTLNECERLRAQRDDLLAALEATRDHLGISRSYKIVGPINEQVRAAIAKAKGETP